MRHVLAIHRKVYGASIVLCTRSFAGSRRGTSQEAVLRACAWAFASVCAYVCVHCAHLRARALRARTYARSARGSFARCAWRATLPWRQQCHALIRRLPLARSTVRGVECVETRRKKERRIRTRKHTHAYTNTYAFTRHACTHACMHARTHARMRRARHRG